jgi:transcriptional regulator with XRE-family HTH domain
MTMATITKHRVIYLRQWRKLRKLTLVRLAEAVGTTHATLSRLEKGLQPYGQDLLERLAEALETNPASLIMYDPHDPDIWTVWDKANPEQRKQIVAIAKILIGHASFKNVTAKKIKDKTMIAIIPAPHR